MDQDGLEQFERVKRLLSHFVTLQSLGVCSSPTAMIFRSEKPIDLVMEASSQRRAQIVALCLLRSQLQVSPGFDGDHSPSV